tara:strand:+ start:4868 stop:5329 length:462 start_codon:yes stop_codon:yes gene_type:complete
MSIATKHLAKIRKKDEYGTPLFLFNKYSKIFGINPKIDYFASETNHVVPKYYTEEDDSFTKSWTEDGFINPPYSLVKKVMEKAYNECKINRIKLLILTYNKTDTHWWHKFIENNPMVEYKFHEGRIKFLCKHGYETRAGAPYPSVWILMNGNV